MNQYVPLDLRKVDAKAIAELAKEVDQGDDNNWRTASSFDTDRAFLAMAEQVKDMTKDIGPERVPLVLAATVVKLLVDNFMLYQIINSDLEG